LAYSLSGEFIPRYAIAILPAFYVISLSSIYQYSRTIKALAITGTTTLFFLSLHPRISDPNSYQFRINEDLSYQDHIAVGQQVAQFIQSNYPETTVFGSFPQRYQLTEPWQGYVSHSLEYLDCDSQILAPNPQSLIIIHPYHYSQLACQDVLTQNPHTLIKEFNVNQIWAQVYQLN
jgi:hypothetical protein